MQDKHLWLKVPVQVHHMEKNPGMFFSKTFSSFRLKKDINILDDMGVSKLSQHFNSAVNLCFKSVLL